MKKDTLKLYVSTILLTLALTTFGFAGEGHCPADPPPPPPDGRGEVVIVNTNPSTGSNFQVLKGFWELLVQSTDLF